MGLSFAGSLGSTSFAPFPSAQVRGVLEEQTKKRFSEFKTLQYRTQVVNGVNYFIKVSGRKDMCQLPDCTLHVAELLPGGLLMFVHM